GENESSTRDVPVKLAGSSGVHRYACSFASGPLTTTPDPTTWPDALMPAAAPSSGYVCTVGPVVPLALVGYQSCIWLDELKPTTFPLALMPPGPYIVPPLVDPVIATRDPVVPFG